MYKNLFSKPLGVLLVLVFIFSVQSVSAGVFSDIKLWVGERKKIRKHSAVVKDAVKTLFKERKSIRNLAINANNLVKSYTEIFKNKAKVGINKLLDIAQSITGVVKEYLNLAPKARKFYNKSKDSLKYFSDLAHRSDTTRKVRNSLTKIPDSEINKLAGSNGWSRVFRSVKSNPLNIFKWGRLKDEYDLGKAEATYPLKCAQMSIEAVGFFESAKRSVASLLSIQDQIKGILDGNLSSILNIGDTVKKIENSGDDINKFGGVVKAGYKQLNGRLNEFIKIQNDYATKLTVYRNKYTPSSKTNSSYPHPTTASSPTTGSRNKRAITSTSAATVNISLQRAMSNYQRAYQNYIKLANNSNVSQATLNNAINKLNKAKQIYVQAKAKANH